MPLKTFLRITQLLFWLCIIAFGLKALKEPDIWWMLRTGEWMVENGRVVTEDSFSFTQAGRSWINVKWLFEVILYGIERIGGPEFTPILQCLVYGLLFFFLQKRTTIGLKKEQKPALILSFLTVGFFALMAVEFRMLGRPEMNSHLLMVIFFYLYERYRQQPSNMIWWLIPLQIVWTNIHEAYGMGMVIILGFLGGHLVEYLWLKQKPLDKRMLISGILAILAISINPRGIQMIAHPLEIFSQLGSNQYTVELVGIQDPLYWRKEAYFFFGFFLLGVLSLWKLGKAKPFNVKGLVNRFGIAWLGLFLLFFYLGIGTYRNIPFFIFLVVPLLSKSLSLFFKETDKQSKRNTTWSIGLMMVFALFYLTIISNRYYEWTNRNDRFGLQIDWDKNPTGVADFMQKIAVNGAGFSDYLSSSYLMWELRPEFKTFIDLRDMDVFTTEDFDRFFDLTADPTTFNRLDEQYDFPFAVVYRPQLDGIHQYLDRAADWELVYADLVAAFYLKKNEQNSPLIDSLNQNLSGSIFKVPEQRENSGIANVVNHLFHPLFSKQAARTVDHELIGSEFFMVLESYNAALYHAKRSMEQEGENKDNLFMMGKVYLAVGQAEEEAEQKANLLQIAGGYFSNLATNYPREAEGWRGLGMLSFTYGNVEQAIPQLRKSIEIAANYEAYSVLSECYARLLNTRNGDLKRLKAAFLEATEGAYQLNPNDPIIQYKLAIIYSQNKDCDAAIKHLEWLSKHASRLTKEQYDNLNDARNACGLPLQLYSGGS